MYTTRIHVATVMPSSDEMLDRNGRHRTSKVAPMVRIRMVFFGRELFPHAQLVRPVLGMLGGCQFPETTTTDLPSSLEEGQSATCFSLLFCRVWKKVQSRLTMLPLLFLAKCPTSTREDDWSHDNGPRRQPRSALSFTAWSNTCLHAACRNILRGIATTSVIPGCRLHPARLSRYL